MGPTNCLPMGYSLAGYVLLLFDARICAPFPFFVYCLPFAGMILDHCASYVTRKPILIRDREFATLMEWDVRIDQVDTKMGTLLAIRIQ